MHKELSSSGTTSLERSEQRRRTADVLSSAQSFKELLLPDALLAGGPMHLFPIKTVMLLPLKDT